MTVMPRGTWTDERLDDLSARVETGFAQTHADIAELRIDNRELRREMHAGFAELRAEIKQSEEALRAEIKQGDDALRAEMGVRFGKVEARIDKLEARMDRMMWTILGTLVTGFVGLILAHLA